MSSDPSSGARLLISGTDLAGLSLSVAPLSSSSSQSPSTSSSPTLMGPPASLKRAAPASDASSRKTPPKKTMAKAYVSSEDIRKTLEDENRAKRNAVPISVLAGTEAELLANRITSAYLDMAFPSLNLQRDALDFMLAGSYTDPGTNWWQEVMPFYNKTMHSLDLLALCVAIWASKHQQSGWSGGFELQAIGHAGGMQGRSMFRRGHEWKVVCDYAEKFATTKLPGGEFGCSRWWVVFKFCTTTLGINLIDSRGTRYQCLKEEIVKEFDWVVPK